MAVVGFSLFKQRLYLFYLSPEDVCRLCYRGNPFPESLEIAKYLKQNSSPDDTVAVIGSEPQIYFYSNRRAATRYIYTYPLMEAHDYAAAMQKEMIQEIESAKPELMVFVNVRTSWLTRNSSVTTIFNWFDQYADNFYDRVGIIEMRPDGQTIYRWDEQTAGYRHTSDRWVAVYKRKH
ncbi:MAG: hypothetical protein MUO27_10845 [Sedimentisphaerales bacterium]|nr:hypothetical protein [Sedimentisphaerales bacterium]